MDATLPARSAGQTGVEPEIRAQPVLAQAGGLGHVAGGKLMIELLVLVDERCCEGIHVFSGFVLERPAYSDRAAERPRKPRSRRSPIAPAPP
jgi:hypothetical protein